MINVIDDIMRLKEEKKVSKSEIYEKVDRWLVFLIFFFF